MNRYNDFLPLLEKGLEELETWRERWGKPESSRPGLVDPEQILDLFLERMKGNYPFHHPSYAGQMLKPPHPAAWLAYTIAMTINPNNHALDGGPPTSEMEKEVVAAIARMAGYGDSALGHLTSGGTIANLEALWVARELSPQKLIASTASAHYTHERMSRILNVRHITVPEQPDGSPDLEFLNRYGDQIGTLVVTMGTTGLGKIEPLREWMNWCRKHSVRVHVDAAYGGFYKLIAGTEWLRGEHWDLIHEADSIVIDPHKHGLQPYGCGCVLFRDASVGRFYRHNSPYTYFTSGDLHLGEISLECSRAGAAAAALWFTFQLLPLTQDGLGSLLISCRRAAQNLAARLASSSRFTLYCEPELDIVAYYPIPAKRTLREVSDASRRIFSKGMEDREAPLYLSLLTVSADEFSALHPGFRGDETEVTILRSVLMKPEHEAFAEEIAGRLEQLCRACVS